MTKFTHRLILGIMITITSALVLSGCSTVGSERLICDFNELMSAVKDAEDGDVILVGDVDFTPISPDFPYSMMNIEVVKSITIKNGKRDGKALFKNAGFILTGSKVSGETLTVHFEGIVFDGLADYENLTAADYDYPWDPVAEDYLHYFPMKAQQAFTLKGNVDASFSNCDIRNYMHEYGPVIDLRYADYTDNEYLLGIFGDQSGCRINLDFDSCTIENNSARYDGGAIYLEGIGGDTVTLVNCEITENSAKAAYGGIYSYHSPNDDLSFGTYYLSMLFCNHTDNTVDTVYDYSAEQFYPWSSHPGDMFVNPHLTMFGCYITDPSFEKDFPHSELPSAENGYNYLSPTHDEASARLKVDSKEAAEKLGTRYGDKLKNPHVGSNYSPKLYKRTQESDTSAVIVIIAVCIVISAGAVVLILRKRLSPLPSEHEPIEAQPLTPEPIEEKKIIMTRHTDEEIDRFIAIVPETQRLTGRELEVLRELLRGRKQSEVAYYLGIEVSTVKDFYRKIYDKLGVPNKQALLEKATEALK